MKLDFEDPVTIMIMLAVASLVAVGLVGYALYEAKESVFGRRLKRVMGLTTKEISLRTRRKGGAQTLTLRRTEKDSDIAALNDLVRLLIPQPQKLRDRIAKTGLKFSLAEYALSSVLGFVAIFFALYGGFKFPLLGALFGAVIIGLGLPHMVVGMLGERRVKKFLEAFPEAIDTICRGLRSGLPVTESIAAVGREMPDPIGIEFRRIADGVRMGRSQEDAMWDVARRLDAPEFRFLIISMTIQKETGGNLAETLGNLADLLRKRRQMRLKVKAMSSEARASAMIIGSLPFVMFGVLMAVNPDYAMTLFKDKRGQMLLGFAFTMILFGAGVMDRMTKFDI